MNSIQKKPSKILQEVIFSTKQNSNENIKENSNVFISGNCYEFALPNYLNFGQKNVKVGIKNIRFPKTKKMALKLKIHACHILEKLDNLKIEEYEIQFKDFDDICQQLELISFKTLGLDSAGSKLDFRNSKYYTYDDHRSIISFSYEHDRIVIRKNIDYVLYFSANFYESFKFDSGQKIKYNDEIYYKLDNTLYLSGYMNTNNRENEVIHFVVYDIIESTSFTPDGRRFPIVCSLYANNDNRCTNEFVAVKSVSVTFVEKLQCYFYNEFFKIFDFSKYDLKSDPLMFTLVFFEI